MGYYVVDLFLIFFEYDKEQKKNVPFNGAENYVNDNNTPNKKLWEKNINVTHCIRGITRFVNSVDRVPPCLPACVCY